MKRNEKIIKLLKIYKDTNNQIHIRTSDRFYNGKILEINLEKEFVIFIDIKLGEIPLLFEDIKGVEPYRAVGG